MVIPVNPELAPGLYLIATPIGAARDITLRALDILHSADMLAAEDTRSLRKLMDIHGVPLGDRPLVSYHDHNAGRARPRIMAALEAGKSVVYASEAGTPMVSDPGFDLARAAVEGGHGLISAPGPSAAVTALTLSGLPADRFFFAGFLPQGGSKRKSALGQFAAVPGTLIFYESPKRVAAMLRDAVEVLGGARPAAMCRELTKKFEEVRRGTLEELAEEMAGRTLKGEIVVLVGQGNSGTVSEIDLDSALSEALEGRSVRDAADIVAAQLGMKRRPVYQRALELAKARE
ncbi:16S rRNA (cytidine(1402)-2'-O)-methyltransferase [Roseovarius sp.]|uniref:16S rRNA (cytidine(1402)-2'-O)-methyltransferase n=1 Tax=Roseovarius sp. TaxID=1486281 RepID=UPI00260AB84A|nr:16S rRNA (cytidine(1402)-2'-O)-methyltransferase [Roseovarius sp.]MDM8167285.1 16S rRNA (cytidine(1402)-2'-O)-methyltransferase [Roseovarius sp.]